MGAPGSVAGLRLLAEGRVDAAAVHLRDADTGGSNDVFARRLIGGGAALLVHLWRRQQGLVVPKGNPSGIRGIADLQGARLAWRAPGTGSRLLLNRLLREQDVVPAPHEEVCDSHFGVAVAVAAGAVDAGLAVRAAAEYVDADFVHLEWEDFELAVDPLATGLLDPAPRGARLAVGAPADHRARRLRPAPQRRVPDGGMRSRPRAAVASPPCAWCSQPGAAPASPSAPTRPAER